QPVTSAISPLSLHDALPILRAQSDLSDLPILVLSALGSASARVRGLREGADDYMTKPFLPEEIIARARTLVTRRLLARRTGELEALSRIAQAALTAASPDLLLFRLVEIVVEVFNADVAVIYMLDEARAELRPRAAVGLPPGVEPAPIPMGVGAVATAIATREPVLISDGAAAAGEPLTRREAFRSVMVAPLVVAGSPDVAALTAQMRAPSFQGEVLLLTRAGDPRPVLATLSAAERHDGGGIQRIGVFRDISREHELRFRVIREQNFRTLGSLAAGVAHNINNRLTPVLGWTEMLQERLNADEAIAGDELKHALTVIHQGASDSVETVRRLQEYSRPSRVKGPDALQLRDVLEHLLALTRPQWDNEAARRGIRYEIDLKADPAPAVLAVASE